MPNKTPTTFVSNPEFLTKALAFVLKIAEKTKTFVEINVREIVYARYEKKEGPCIDEYANIVLKSGVAIFAGRFECEDTKPVYNIRVYALSCQEEPVVSEKEGE